jgi:methionyl-tRNA synthetase
VTSHEKILVTSALPYANGPLHLGHIAGAYLPADIYVRYQRMRGRDVVYVCGTDEHGVAITIAAEKAKKSPKEFVDFYWAQMNETFAKAGISFDIFCRTTTPEHYPISQEFFLTMHKKGLLVEKAVKQLYCPNDKRFLADRYVEGTCPNCGTLGARGDQCEACGKWIDQIELRDPKCVVCGARPVIRETKHFFIPLGRFQEQVKNWLDTKTNWRDNVLNFCYGWIKEGLSDRAITRDITWGVPVPLPGYEGKVLYVWFDAPIGYISATQVWAKRLGQPEKWKEYWLNPKTKLVHFIGKDNIVFHAIVWPAMLMAQDGYILPADVPANEFLNLEGRKFSTSRNFAVWLHEYLEKFPPDPLRYAMAANLPEGKDADFSWKELQTRNNSELADILGNFINRTLTFVKKNYANRVPARGALNERDQRTLELLQSWPQRLSEFYERYEFRRATQELMDLARHANKYFNDEEPWRTLKTDRPRCDTTLHICLHLCKALAVLMAPTLPFSAARLWKMLNLAGTVEKQDWLTTPVVPLPANHELNEPEILFTKIEDETIAPEIARLQESLQKMQQPNQTAAPPEVVPKPAVSAAEPPVVSGVEPLISIDTFKQIDLRVAEVLAAAKVPKADKLLQLKIRVGAEERQLVAGIAQHYQPEELIGKKVVIVANLEPAKIRGLESQGMILAASAEDGKLSIISPEREMVSGAKVK